MKKFKRILVTSALPYANGPLHLGHLAGAYLPADIFVRYQRLKGQDVVFISGSDEHGVPITVTADKEKISPQDVVDRYHEMNKESFSRLGIDFDHYSRTSLPIHHETAQQFFLQLYKQGDLIQKEEEQFFSELSQRFLPDRYVEGVCPHCHYDKARGDQCDNCGKWLEPGELLEPVSKIDGSRPVLRKTSHWYLPMGRFADEWKAWFDQNTWKENVRNFSIGWYNEGLRDRPITRDLHWGIPVPLEDAEGKVLYVWFDAPIGYISATKEWALKIGDPDRWKKYWCDCETRLVHFIGKDNIVFHAILFPMVLMRVGGYVLPDAIPANEYLTIEVRKISTSQNYAIWVNDYLKLFQPDSLRYTLAANAPESKDTDFSWIQFQGRHNNELADILGNFVYRTVSFCHRFYGGKVPEAGALEAEDRSMMEEAHRASGDLGELFERFEVRSAAKRFMDVCRLANKYFNDRAPWETRNTDPQRCAATIHVCLQICRVLGVLMSPILPFTSRKLMEMLNVAGPLSWNEAVSGALPEGHPIGEGVILFEKIEDDVIQQEMEKMNRFSNEAKPGTPVRDMIDFQEFKRVILRTGLVIEAERIEGANKILKLLVDLGDEKRQIVAGVAESYAPESLKGKTVIVAANLKPAKIRNVESNGMVLAVKTSAGYSLLTTDGPADPGVLVE